MTLLELIAENKEAIASQWKDKILATYPAETAKLWKKKKNQFLNPVGYVIDEMIESVLENLISVKAPEVAAEGMMQFAKVRAVQEYAPSGALACIFELKAIVWDLVNSNSETPIDKQHVDEFLGFTGWLDSLGLLTFDKYMKNREKVWSLRADELKRISHVLLKRANIDLESHVTGSDLRCGIASSVNKIGG